MSLLNEMLKDLDHKKPQPRVGALSIASWKRSLVKPLLNGLCWLLLLGMFAGFAYELIYGPKPLIKKEASTEPPQLNSSLPPVPGFAKADQTLRENAASLDTEFNDDETELSLNEENINEKSEAWYDEHLNQALEAIQEGEDPRAIDLLTGILQKFPASVEARENLAALYFSHGTLSKASDVVEEGLAFEPNNLRLSLLQARVYVEQSQPQKALKTLEQFKPTIQKVPEYYALLAAVFEALGRTDEAGTVYQNLIQIDPNNGQYWLGLGVALENKRSFQQAIEAFRRAAQSDNLQLSARNYAENRISNLQG